MGRGLLFKLLRMIDNQTLRRASTIVVLSEDMAETIRERKLGKLNICIIKNFSLTGSNELGMAPAHLKKPAGKIRAIFAGNLGVYQNLELIAKGVSGCFDKYPNLELMFLGDGAMESTLKIIWKNHPQVVFAPFLPFADARMVIQNSDIGIVSLVPGMYRVSSPSKMITYLDLGVPILVVVESNSSIAKETRSRSLGVVPEDMTAHSITKALESLLASGVEKEQIYNWVLENTSKDVLASHWRQIFSSHSDAG
jgi:glycosyltransferase involved in cell wall biosynthesis